MAGGAGAIAIATVIDGQDAAGRHRHRQSFGVKGDVRGVAADRQFRAVGTITINR